MSGAISNEDLAAEVALARGDAKACRVAITGTETQPGLRERLHGLQARHEEHQRSTESRWEAIERWLGKIDGRMAATEGRRPHPLVIGVLVVSMMVLALSGLIVAGAAAYAVKTAVEHEALERSER